MVSDPNPRKVCSRPLCPLNNEEKCLNKCFNESVGYYITCRRCLEASRSGGPPPRVYIGETHRSLYTRFQGHLGDLKAALKHSREGKSGSWMASHIREAHGGLHNEANPGLDWVASLGGQHPKPLERQVKEMIEIKKAKSQGVARINGKEEKVNKEVFNTKDEWYSHTSMWDVVGT